MSATPGATIRDATPADAAAIADIYNHYIRESIATFEEDPVTPTDMATRVADVQESFHPWLIAEQNGRTLGYAYAMRLRPRSAYRFAAEVTVYVAPDLCGRGVGSVLYTQLFAILRERGFRTVIGGISLPNEASVALHEKLGMHKVAHFEQVGFKFDRWIDVGYWQGPL